jgi:hypothetical protein
MRMIEIYGRLYEVLLEKRVNNRYVYYILRLDGILYCTTFDCDHKYFNTLTIEKLKIRIHSIKNTTYRNQMLKDSSLELNNEILSEMLNFMRNDKIDEIVENEFIWQFV